MDGFDYEEMVQEGLRGVVREALKTTAVEGLPGAHHFYVAFKTDYPGVQLADYLRERHPEEMTIVIQHQYWELEVDDQGFYVTLSFSDSQEKIYVPFHALISFMDPYAKFGLQFTPPPVIEREESSVPEDFSLSKGKDNVVTLDKFRKK
ncbi:ClpXP protease specificity-enhancing factor SspB [Kamptonema cortianum]|nr:ClpXP protease specificity-enhancing factor SspB [Geitlerinema splendidum]MDK3161244.1 ClpXP protease specificity-enhancing factor SspB [Kamptonema cortianum]